MKIMNIGIVFFIKVNGLLYKNKDIKPNGEKKVGLIFIPRSRNMRHREYQIIP